MKTQFTQRLLALVAFTNILFTFVNAQHSEFYGMTKKGGAFNTGTIFRTDGDGNNLQVVSSFPAINSGSRPVGKLCEANHGKLYGMTGGGGSNDMGVLFEWDPETNSFSKKLDFKGAENGRSPFGSLIMGENGKLYGMTSYGGIHDDGVLYEWDPATDTYTKKLDFNGAENGSHPGGEMIEAANGKLYGMTASGGDYDMGVIFEWDLLNNFYSKKFDFEKIENGKSPYGSLIQAENGKFYGVTWEGGANGYGVLFEWDLVTNTYTKKLDFNGTENGSEPQGSLIQANNGKIYGMTSGGGTNDHGVFYEWDPAGDIYAKKIDFSGTENGRYPNGSMLTADSNKLYCLTTYGGLYDQGVLFEWDLSTDTYIKKLDFNGNNNGGWPAYLMRSVNDKIYVMTTAGSVNEEGAIIECNPVTNVYTKRIGFLNNWAENGKYPCGTLVQANNGKLYGMTTQGGLSADSARGRYNNGVLFEFDPVTNAFNKKFDFRWAETGGNPMGSLVKGIDGKLYGMTPYGGVSNDPVFGEISHGVLFEWDTDENTYTIKHKFDVINGSYPQGSLMLATDGKFYGLTSEGGTFNYGVIFEFDPATDSYIKRFDFNLTENGGDPRGTLMQANNGKLYGITSSGGLYGDGVLFDWDPLTNLFVKQLDFDRETNGCGLGGSMVVADNGKLYGMTMRGGIFDHGVLYEWDPVNNTYTLKLNFNDTIHGESPYGSLVRGANGKLFGMTWDEGVNGYGVLFEWDTDTDSLIIKYDFAGDKNKGNYKMLSELATNSNLNIVEHIDGSYFSGGLLELVRSTSGTINAEACDSYISPSGHHSWVHSGIYIDTIPNQAGFDSVITVNLTIRKAEASITQNQSVLTANASEATYQWVNCDDGNKFIEGEIHQTFTAIADGNYAVIVSQNGCIDTSVCLTVSITRLMVNTFKHNITLYPNPSDGKFSIDLGGIYPNAEITITQLDGRVIRQEHIMNTRFRNFQLSESPGLYLISVVSGNERAVFKLSKK